MTNTDMTAALGWSSNRGIVLSKSPDLINWTHSPVIIGGANGKFTQLYPSITMFRNLNSAWAPQVFYDPSVQKYMVFFSIATSVGNTDNAIIYYFYTNEDFTDLEDAFDLTENQLLFVGDGTGNHVTAPPNPGNAAIDGDIVYWNGDYYLFYKTEGWRNGSSVSSYHHEIVKLQSQSGKVTGPYWGLNNANKSRATPLDTTSANIEGSSTFRLIGTDTWYLIYDVYSNSPRNRYDFNRSTNPAAPLDGFTRIPDGGSSGINRNFNPMHGSVIPLTANEKAALLAKWGTN